MDYIAFIKEHKDSLELWATLDVIGDDKATWENQRIMEEHGVGGIPVFHLEDDIKYLYRCLDYKYFALGGIAGAGSSERRRIHFLDMCWDIICDSDGIPKCRVHGFGLASPTLLHRYPWYSYDSSSWVSYGRFGIVIMPFLQGGKFTYNHPPIKIFVSNRSPRKADDGVHFDTLSEMEKGAFLEYIHGKGIKLGSSNIFDVHENYSSLYDLTYNQSYANKEKTLIEEKITIGVINDNVSRDFVNYTYYCDLAKSMEDYKDRRFIRPKLPTLF